MAQTNQNFCRAGRAKPAKATSYRTRAARHACSHLCHLFAVAARAPVHACDVFHTRCNLACRICAVPVINNIAIRFLFSPGNSAGSVSVDTFLWWCACFVALATFTYRLSFVARVHHGSHTGHMSLLLARFLRVQSGPATPPLGTISAARRCVLTCAVNGASCLPDYLF